MTKFTDDLKRIFDGLAHQWAPDYLSTREKTLLLDKGRRQPVFSEPASAPDRMAAEKKAGGQVAIVADADNLDFLLEYVLKTCPEKCSQIDLFIQGSPDLHKLAGAESRLAKAGLRHTVRHLQNEGSETLLDYVSSNPALLYLVSTPTNTTAKAFMDYRIPNGSHRMYVPLVLIDTQEPQEMKAQNIA